MIRRVMLHSGCAIAIAYCAQALHADTIELSSHQQVAGTVTKYANHSFEVRTQDGKAMNYPESSVRQIVFASSGSPAKFNTRTSGIQEATPASFANGAFTVTTGGTQKQLSLMAIERVSFVPDRGQEIEVITHGQQVDVAKHLVAGSITMVEFYADWCGPCRQVSPYLDQMAKTDPEIALRKIDIVNWGSPVAQQYRVNSIPYVKVFNRTGQLVGDVVGVDVEGVKRYVAKAKAGG
jgi:thioredoxin 1